VDERELLSAKAGGRKIGGVFYSEGVNGFERGYEAVDFLFHNALSVMVSPRTTSGGLLAIIRLLNVDARFFWMEFKPSQLVGKPSQTGKWPSQVESRRRNWSEGRRRLSASRRNPEVGRRKWPEGRRNPSASGRGSKNGGASRKPGIAPRHQFFFKPAIAAFISSR
jgi:hypothetical protein